MNLDQLTCSECGKTYYEPELGPDNIRFSEICVDCRPKPAFASVTFGNPFMVSQPSDEPGLARGDIC